MLLSRSPGTPGMMECVLGGSLPALWDLVDPLDASMGIRFIILIV